MHANVRAARSDFLPVAGPRLEGGLARAQRCSLKSSMTPPRLGALLSKRNTSCLRSLASQAGPRAGRPGKRILRAQKSLWSSEQPAAQHSPRVPSFSDARRIRFPRRPALGPAWLAKEHAESSRARKSVTRMALLRCNARQKPHGSHLKLTLTYHRLHFTSYLNRPR